MLTLEQIKTLPPEELLKLVNKQAQVGATIKVAPKGGVSVYGMGQFPVTLYASQWEKLFSKVDEIRAFIKANEASLAVKAPKA